MRRRGRPSRQQDAAVRQQRCPSSLRVGDIIAHYGFRDADADAVVPLVCEAEVLAVLPGDLCCTLLWGAPYHSIGDFSFQREDFGLPGGWVLVAEAVEDDGDADMPPEGTPLSPSGNAGSPPLLTATPRSAEGKSQSSKRRRLDPSLAPPARPDSGGSDADGLRDGLSRPDPPPAEEALPSECEPSDDTFTPPGSASEYCAPEAEEAPALAWEGGSSSLELGEDVELRGEEGLDGGKEDPAWWRAVLVGAGNDTLTVRYKTVAACDAKGKPLRDQDGIRFCGSHSCERELET